MTKLLAKYVVGDTIVRLASPADGKCEPQLALHPKSLAPVNYCELLPPDVKIVDLPAMWLTTRASSLASVG
jgi:hypothetical protein